MRAYIVEDSKVVLDRMVSLFGEIDGLEVVGHTGSVKTAIEDILRLRPDVMLIDIRLSDGNGLDILEKIQTCRLNIIPIVMTLHTYPAHRKVAIKHGAVHFFDKARELWKIPVALKRMIAAQRAA